MLLRRSVTGGRRGDGLEKKWWASESPPNFVQKPKHSGNRQTLRLEKLLDGRWWLCQWRVGEKVEKYI
jgi:hypothetical protein